MANRLIFETALDGSGFERGLSRLGSGALAGFKNTVLAAFGVFSVSQAVRGTIEWASELRDTADMLGVNVEWLQKMQNGAALVGAEISDVAKFINELNRARGDALNNPSGANAQAFGRLGFSSNDIGTLNTQAFMERLVKGFSTGASTQMVNDLQEVGGRSARNLIAAFSAQFASDTPILAEELIDQLDDIGDQFTILATIMKVELAPAILAVVESVLTAVGNMKQTGAGVGGFLDRFRAAFSRTDFGDLTESGRRNFWLVLGRSVMEGWEGFQSAVVSEAADQTSLGDSAAAGRAAVRAARSGRAGAAPIFETNLKPEKAAQAAKISTDALVSVGNFLGSSRGVIEGLAQRQVDLLTRIEQNTRPASTTQQGAIYPPP